MRRNEHIGVAVRGCKRGDEIRRTRGVLAALRVREAQTLRTFALALAGTAVAAGDHAVIAGFLPVPIGGDRRQAQP